MLSVLEKGVLSELEQLGPKFSLLGLSDVTDDS
jgi:hypothetical protein